MKRTKKVKSAKDETNTTMPLKSPSPSKIARKVSPDKDALPQGEVLHDSEGRGWTVGDILGHGQRAPLYTVTMPKSKEEFVMKYEPKSSGPLFKEFNFYQRVAKKKNMDAWLKQKSLDHVGIPVLVGSGVRTSGDAKHRFLVLPRLGPDLQSLMADTQNMLCVEVVLWLGIKLLDCLEYLHEHDYTHGDIKASNILLGYSGEKIQDSKIYLVDYGLSHRYLVDGKQKPYQENLKLNPDGTPAFMSRDAHKSVAPSRRGDLEVLGYCLLQWLCGPLPWEDKLNDMKYVRDSKIKYMNNIAEFVDSFISLDSDEGSSVASALTSYLTYVKNLGYEEKPEYNTLRNTFRECLVELGVDSDWLPELCSQNRTTRIGLSPKKSKESSIHKPALGKQPMPKMPLFEEPEEELNKKEEPVKRRRSRSMKLEEPPKITTSNRGRAVANSRPPVKPSKIETIQEDDTELLLPKSLPLSSKPTTNKMADNRGPSSKVKVTLNVGGTNFVTFRSTIQKHPSKLRDMVAEHSSEEELFFDRDFTYFAYILNFLRDEQTTLPDTALEMIRLREESVYYGLSALTRRIDKELKDFHK